MKHLIAILMLAGCTASPAGDHDTADAAACPPATADRPGFTYGRTSGSTEVGAGSNTLLGIPIEIPADGVLTGIGIIATQTDGEQIYFGLYTDDHGQPGELIQTSPLTTLVAGTNEAAVPHTRISAGAYWLMEISTGSTHFASDGATIDMTLSVATFGPLPARVMGSARVVSGKAPNAFVRLVHWADYGL